MGKAKKEKKIVDVFKLQIPAGQANPAPPVGPALGQRGINIKEFTDQFNNATKDLEKGMPTPVVVTAYADRSFSMEIKTPPASFLILKVAKKKKGSGVTGKEIIGRISNEQLKPIAEMKMKDLNANDLDAAISMLRGTAKSMGFEVEE